jgi:RND family efflux transporter MFP subunit
MNRPSWSLFVMTRLPIAVAALLTPWLLSACSEPPREAITQRTVLLADVAPAPAALSSVTAEIRQAQRAKLSFDVAGRITSIAVKPGDAFAQGQVLAALDPAPLRMRLTQARAEAAAAHAEGLDRAEQLRQQVALFDDGAASQTALSMARAADQVALGKAQAADAVVALATRDLQHAALMAPFAGHVVSRTEEPDHDVAAGQVILTIDGQGQFEVIASLPASVRSSLTVGSEAAVIVTDAAPVPVRLSQLSDHVGKGATVDAIFRTTGAPATLTAGELVQLRLTSVAGVGRLAIPLTAVLPGAAVGTDSVFVFDATHGQVNRKPVTLAGRAGDRVLVSAGLAVGDRVVTAGTAFLVDGQHVREFESTSALEAH